MRALSSLAVVVTACAGLCACLWGGLACTPAPGPTAAEGAAHLGLESGTTFSYIAGESVTETHEVKTSGVLFDGVAVDVLAKQNGFAKDERTITFGVDVAQASILRFQDCIARCAQPSAPIPFLNWPLTEGDSVEGDVDVTVSDGDSEVVRRERHTTTVGPPESVTVRAGTFDDAFLISWTRTITNVDESTESESNVLRWVPDLGIVKWDAPDGTVLELSTKP